MNEHERLEDPAFDRLVAADPARRASGPVPGVLRAKVDALIAEQAEQGPAEPGSGERGPGTAELGSASREQADDLAVRRHRRRTPWLVAAAVAGIVAAGGGGYVAGEQGLGEVTTAVGGADSGDAAQDEAAPEAATEGVQPLEAAGDVPEVTGLVFHAGVGLSDTPTTAQVRFADPDSPGESLGAYPVVSEVEAVDRLGDPRFAGAALGWSRQAPAPEDAGPRTVPEPGGSIDWPVADVTIVSAKLTEVRYRLSDGTELFVPAYELADAEGRDWTVMAVDEELLDFAP